MSRFELTASQCDCGLVDFYKNVCIVAGQDPCNIDLRFDCRNIHVTASVQEKIFNYYKLACNSTDEGFSALWILYGPKADLEEDGYFVQIDEGFFTEVHE